MTRLEKLKSLCAADKEYKSALKAYQFANSGNAVKYWAHDFDLEIRSALECGQELSALLALVEQMAEALEQTEPFIGYTAYVPTIQDNVKDALTAFAAWNEQEDVK